MKESTIGKKENAAKKRFQLANLQRILALGAVVILYIFFSLFGTNFSSTTTLINILDSTYYIGFMALGVTFVIISGGIDLSIGTNMMCSALIGGYLYSVCHVPMGVSLAIIVVIATLFGLLNGFLISELKLPPFIATLGVMMVTQGFGAIITKVQTQHFPSNFDVNGWYKSVFYKTQGGFPTGAIYTGLFFLLALFVLNKTRFGRYIYAIGSNEEAVRLSGIDVAKWKTLTYTICGFFSGLSAIVYAATYTTVIPGTGNGLELKAIAAAIIGGTSLTGGIGTMFGTMIGAFLMSILNNGLMSMGFQAQYQLFFTGIVIVLAVLLDIYRSKKFLKD